MTYHTDLVTQTLLRYRYKWGFPSDLSGACGHAAFTLVHFGGVVKWGMANDIGHCWVEHEGKIYDPTAMQLGPTINYKAMHTCEHVEELFDFVCPPTKADIKFLLEKINEHRRRKQKGAA